MSLLSDAIDKREKKATNDYSNKYHLSFLIYLYSPSSIPVAIIKLRIIDFRGDIPIFYLDSEFDYTRAEIDGTMLISRRNRISRRNLTFVSTYHKSFILSSILKHRINFSKRLIERD